MIPTFSSEDYRAILQSILLERRSRNPRYSLRGFARDIGVDASRLARILKGVQGISERTAASIATRLRFSPEDTERFIVLVRASDSRSRATRRTAERRLSKGLGAAGPDESAWETFALRECLAGAHAIAGPPEEILQMISEKLRVPRETLESLRMQLPSPPELTRKWVLVDGKLAAPFDDKPETLSRFIARVTDRLLQDGERSVPNDSPFSYAFVTLRPSQLDRLRALISQFRAQVDEICEERAPLALVPEYDKPCHLFSIGLLLSRIE